MSYSKQKKRERTQRSRKEKVEDKTKDECDERNTIEEKELTHAKPTKETTIAHNL